MRVKMRDLIHYQQWVMLHPLAVGSAYRMYCVDCGEECESRAMYFLKDVTEVKAFCLFCKTKREKAGIAQ